MVESCLCGHPGVVSHESNVLEDIEGVLVQEGFFDTGRSDDQRSWGEAESRL
jgi:hypothetical protein